jgi:hypothetical protein
MLVMTRVPGWKSTTDASRAAFAPAGKNGFAPDRDLIVTSFRLDRTHRRGWNPAARHPAP